MTQLKERLGTEALKNIGYAPPSLRLPADLTVEASGEQTLVDVGAAISDEGVAITNDAPASFPIGKTAVTWTATNEYGMTNTATQWITVSDSIPPVIHGDVTEPPNAYGWYNHDITVHFTATDSGSGVDKVTPDSIVSTEGTEQFVKGEAFDKAGNFASFIVDHIDIDKTAPVLSVKAPVAKTYTTTDQLTISYDVNDRLSGVERCSSQIDGQAVNNGEKIDLTSAAGSHLLEVTAQDKAGNTVTQSVYFDVLIHALVNIQPETLHLQSNGGANSMTAAIEFPSGYDISKVDLSTVQMIVNGKTIDGQGNPEAMGEDGEKKAGGLKVKFDRQKVIVAIGENNGSTLTVTVTGKLNDGSGFTGTTTVKVN